MKGIPYKLIAIVVIYFFTVFWNIAVFLLRMDLTFKISPYGALIELLFISAHSIVTTVIAHLLVKRNVLARYAAIFDSLIIALLNFPLMTLVHGTVVYSLLFDKQVKGFFEDQGKF